MIKMLGKSVTIPCKSRLMTADVSFNLALHPESDSYLLVELSKLICKPFRCRVVSGECRDVACYVCTG